MKLLNVTVIKELQEIFNDLKKEVYLKFFTQEIECRFCSDTRQLLTEVSEVSDKINLEVFDFIKDKPEVEKFTIDKIPATVVIGEEDRGIRFYGIPGGYEFSSLLQAIKTVSTGEVTLEDKTKRNLDSLKDNVHLQVMVTPTCTYCPQAVILAHQFAFYSPKVTADMVETSEFPHLTQKYQVMGVPRTIINETGFLEGAAPESVLLDKIKETVK